MPGEVPARRTAWALRALVALAVAVSAVVHLYLVLAQDYGGGDGNWLFYAFWAQGVGGVLLAALLLVWRSALPLLGAVAFGVGTLGGFLLAVYLPDGLLGVQSRWFGWPEWVSAITEAIAIVGGLAALAAERGRTRVTG